MPAIPTTEPQSITAGDTLEWKKALPDYPSSLFVLKYSLQRIGSPLIRFAATADESGHAVTVAADVTANFLPGVYAWTSFAEGISTGRRHTIARGTISILPSPLAELGSSHASRMLALIEAALEGRIPRGLETTDIDGQVLERISFEQLHKLKVVYRAEVTAETNRAEIAAGLPNRRNSFARFTRVS